MLHRMLLGW